MPTASPLGPYVMPIVRVEDVGLFTLDRARMFMSGPDAP